jgi:tetratricopeptide (TPR) repeat protein
VEAQIGADAGTLLWMIGEFDEARRFYEAGHIQLAQLGKRVANAHASQGLGWLELMAGDAAEADRILGGGARALRELGSVGASKLLNSMHAHALYAADQAAIDGWDASGTDVAGNVLSMTARAKVAARRGALGDAETMAREAIALIEPGDFIVDQADAWMALAEVLDLAGRAEEAAAAVHNALDRYQRKGNVTQSAMAEARLAELSA